jgi:predicted O-linked N-acetylglucosamine transferase (SPINDLY family)
MSKLGALLSLLSFRSRDPRTLWVQARLALAIGNRPWAADIYHRLMSGKLDSPESYLYASLAARRLQRPGEAIAVLEAGLQQFPDLPLLFRHYVRLCAELDQIDGLILRLAASNVDKWHACKQVFDQFPNPLTQSNFISQCLHSGFADLARPMVELLLSNSDDNVLLWRLADTLLSHSRTEEAKLIYQQLAVRPAENALGLLHSALAEQRLGNVERAAHVFEAGIQRFPNAAELIEHFALICAQLRQMNRVIRLTVPDAKSELQACEALFARFPDPRIQVGLIDHCLDRQLEQLAEQRIKALQESSNSAFAMWQVSELLLLRGRTEEAQMIHQKLSDISPRNAEDFHLTSLALICLSEPEKCMKRIEEGLFRYPTAGNLLSLYVSVCAKRFEYDRYHDFMVSLSAADLPPPLSMLNFYRASMSAPVDFVINLQEIELRINESDVCVLRQDFYSYLQNNPQPIKIAKVLVFYSHYLNLAADFRAGVYNALQIVFEGDSKASRSLEIMHHMTPPMIPGSPVQPEADIHRFIEAGYRFAENPLILNEPIADMTNNWTPWQYVFCLVAPRLYSAAIDAFQEFAFTAWPKLNFTAEHTVNSGKTKRNTSEKVRIGFIVHDSMPMMSGFLPKLDKERFDTIYLRPGKSGNSTAARQWIARSDRVVQYSDVDMYSAIQTIANEKLDIIVSGPSIAAVYYPMMARLAPLQIVLLEPNWTDGLTNADYYISWKTAEPDCLSDFYKTKVALFQHPPYWIEKPEVLDKGSISPATRASIRNKLLNADDEARIYLCANTPPKIHSDMDSIFADILDRDKNSIVVLLRGEYPPTKTLKKRLRERLGPRFDRVVFMPTMSKDDAHVLLQSVDCCLDSYPLCGMSSSFDGAMLGIPTVTLPADIPFGRWTAAIYEYIGVTTLIAENREDYIDKALRLASDKEWRDQLSEEIKRASGRFVESEPTSQEFEAFLMEAWKRKLQGLPPTHWINGRWQ